MYNTPTYHTGYTFCLSQDCSLSLEWIEEMNEEQQYHVRRNSLYALTFHVYLVAQEGHPIPTHEQLVLLLLPPPSLSTDELLLRCTLQAPAERDTCCSNPKQFWKVDRNSKRSVPKLVLEPD